MLKILRGPRATWGETKTKANKEKIIENLIAYICFKRF
jgi:hypothetical protein